MSQALKEARERAEKELLALADIADERKLTEDERSRVDELRAELDDLKDRAALAAEANAVRGAQAEDKPVLDMRSVAKPATGIAAEVRETSPYGEGSGESWFVDQHTVRNRFASDSDVTEARERLMRHYAAVKDEGGVRQARALSTTTAAEGGYLVAPAHVQSLFARLLVNGATVTQLVNKMPLPPKTDQINLPKQSGGTSVAQHVQNEGLSETSAAFGTVQFNAFRYGGAQTIPNFLLDRSLPGVDQIVMGDLGRQLASKLDSDIIAAGGNGLTGIEGILAADGIGTATATAGTATWADLYPALVNAIADVQTAHYASPDAIVMHPRRWAWCLAQVDSDDRALIGAVSPQNAVAGFNGPVAPPEGAMAAVPVGNILGIPVYLDSNIPTTLGAGTDEDRIIVGVFKEAMLFQSAPMFAVSTEAEFLKDQTLVRVTQDVAFTAERYPGAFSVVSGTALNDVA
jgi:HK97 family phage major capsid protein